MLPVCCAGDDEPVEDDDGNVTGPVLRVYVVVEVEELVPLVPLFGIGGMTATGMAVEVVALSVVITAAGVVVGIGVIGAPPGMTAIGVVVEGAGIGAGVDVEDMADVGAIIMEEDIISEEEGVVDVA